MNNQRISCEKCGKPLVNGISYTVEGIQCSCGHYTEFSRGHIVEEEDAVANGACVFKGRAKARTPYRREKKVMWRGQVDI